MKSIFRSLQSILFPVCGVALLLLQACSESSVITRTEYDFHHKVYVEEKQRSEALGEDFGVLKPSRRQMILDKTITEYDSICRRDYPAFARFGLFEVAGLVTGVETDDRDKIGNGLFGVYNTFGPASTREEATLNGYLYRIGIWDSRFEYLGKDWTIGTALVEGIFGNVRDGQQLIGVLPVYLKKRFFFTQKSPYVSVQPFVGVSMFSPFRYINIGATAQLGSFGGANLYAHLGFAYGARAREDVSKVASARSIPYAGLGISMFDFTNTEQEMETEWKLHASPARRMALLHLTFLQSSLGSSDVVINGNKSNEKHFITDWDGLIFQFGVVAFPADFIAKRVTLGTSIINVMYLGEINGGVGILPIRLTYLWQPFEKISIDPFFELNYYPSHVAHVGLRLNLGDLGGFNLGGQAGYLFGDSGDLTKNFFPDFTVDVSGFYAGISVSLFDFYSSPIIEHFKSLKPCETPFGEY